MIEEKDRRGLIWMLWMLVFLVVVSFAFSIYVVKLGSDIRDEFDALKINALIERTSDADEIKRVFERADLLQNRLLHVNTAFLGISMLLASPIGFLIGFLREYPKVEQDGTGQPAPRPESKSEGSDKPQPEAEGRSR